MAEPTLVALYTGFSEWSRHENGCSACRRNVAKQCRVSWFCRKLQPSVRAVLRPNAVEQYC